MATKDQGREPSRFEGVPARTRLMLERARSAGDRDEVRFPVLIELEPGTSLGTLLDPDATDGVWVAGLTVSNVFVAFERLVGPLPAVTALATFDALDAWDRGVARGLARRLEIGQPERAAADRPVADRRKGGTIEAPPDPDKLEGFLEGYSDKVVLERIRGLLAAGPDDDRAGEVIAQQRDGGVEGVGGREDDRPVVVGVIDDGMAIALDRFRSGTRSRVSHCLIQDAGSADPFVNELRSDGAGGLDDLLARHSHAGIVDEGAVYRDIGLLDFSRADRANLGRIGTHGAAVMDLAAGRPHDPARPTDDPIIAVQLPPELVPDTAFEDATAHVWLAIVYILVRSLEHARDGRAPAVVINLSFANTAGPHDGSTTFERLSDWLVSVWQLLAPVQLVLAAGNHRRVGLHAESKLAANVADALTWRVLPDDGTPNTMEIWLDPPTSGGSRGTPRLKLRLVAPGGGATDWVHEGDPTLHELRDGRHAVIATATSSIDPRTGRSSFALLVEPTTAPNDADIVAPAGRWRVEMQSREPLVVHAWIQRDDASTGHRALGRQSWFDQPSNPRFDEVRFEPDGTLRDVDGDGTVKRDWTVSAIATGNVPVVVGSYVTAQKRMAVYSGDGAKPPDPPDVPPPYPGSPPRRLPDVLAESDASAVRRGVLASNARSGGARAWSGTSVATPQVTRFIAATPGARSDRDTLLSHAQALERTDIPGLRHLADDRASRRTAD